MWLIVALSLMSLVVSAQAELAETAETGIIADPQSEFF